MDRTPEDLNAADVKTKDRLLTALLPNIPFDGWTDAALRLAADSAGIDRNQARQLFPSPASMVAHMSDWADRRMLDALSLVDPASLKLRERVALAVRTRLEALDGNEDAVRRGLVVLAMPQNAVLASRLLYDSVDRIWRAVGDRSTDYNFYTKRGLLAGVVSATTVYWLNDDSPGKADSWRFLDRRIDDVMKVGRSVGRAVDPGQWSGFLASPLRFARAVRRQVRRA